MLVTVKRALHIFQRYLKLYGDVPVFVAMGNETCKVADIVAGSMESDNDSTSKMNVCIVCDEEALQNAYDGYDPDKDDSIQKDE